MSQYLLTGEITMELSASRFLRMFNNQRTKKNIESVRFIPPVLGSDSLGTYEVKIKYEPNQKFKHASAIG